MSEELKCESDCEEGELEQLAALWQAQAETGRWDAGYTNTFLRCARELREIIQGGDATCPQESNSVQTEGLKQPLRTSSGATESPTPSVSASVSEIAREALHALRWHPDLKRQEAFCDAGNLNVIKDAVEQGIDMGIRGVRLIRCAEHRTVPQFNSAEITGAECAACAVSAAIAPLQKELDASKQIQSAEKQILLNEVAKNASLQRENADLRSELERLRSHDI